MRTMLKESLRRLAAHGVRFAALLFAIGVFSTARAATPLAVWNGDFGVATTRNGVTFDANGNTVAPDGSYVEIGSSSTVGVKFSTSTAYNYLQVVFTVSDLDEDAASDRALVQTYSGTTSEGGVYLKNGTIGTSGINGDAKWSSADPASDGTLTSYSEDESTERTYAVECAHSTSTYWGLHLYELGSGARSVVFGSSSSIGLRYQTKYDCVTIGGKLSSSSNFAAMPGLKIKKVAIYVSDSSFPLDNSAMTGYIFPESSVVASGASTSISALNTSAPVWTLIQSGATVTVDAEPAGDIMFIGDAFSMSGSTVTASGVALDLAGTALTSLTVKYGTGRALSLANVGDVPVTVVLDEVSDDDGSIAITGGSDAYTYKVVRTDGRTAAATYDNGTVTYKNYAAGNSSITLTADANLSALCGEVDFGAATSTLTVSNDCDCVLTVDEDMANASITFTGSGTTTLAIANGVTFTAPATFTNSGTGSVIVRVDAGGTAEINGKQSFLTVPSKFVLNGGSLVNNGGDIGIGDNQISVLELTADSYVGGTCTFGLVGSQYAATTLTLNGYTLTMNITGGNKLFLLNSVESDDGTIRVKQGVFACYYQNGSARQNTLNCTVVLDNDYYQQDGTTYSGANSGYCEFFIANNGSQPTVKNIYATNGKGGMISGYSETRILTVTGTLGLPFKETITPKLALADGATLKALTSDGAACPVYGFSIAESATIYVDVSDIILSQTTPIFTWTSETKPNGTFVFKDVDLRTTYELVKGDTGLTINQYVARATVGGVVTPYYSLTDAIQNADDDTEIDVFVTSSENAVTVAKDATISLGENNVTINTLTVSKNAKLTLTGSGTFTIGALAGEGTLSIDAQDTVALSVPVGTTFGSFACNTKLTVTGAIAKNTTLFTIGSGSYANERVATADYGDVHYTATDGAYVVGKTYYWISNGTGNTTSNPQNYINDTRWWSDTGSDGTTCNEIPLALDKAIFDKEGRTAMVTADMPYDVEIVADFTFHNKDKTALKTIGLVGKTTFKILDGIVAKITTDSASDKCATKLASKLVGNESATLLLVDAVAASGNNEIHISGDTSEFKGVVDIQVNPGCTNARLLIDDEAALDNSLSKWYVSTNGVVQYRDGYPNRTFFGVQDSSKEYKFGVFQAYITACRTTYSNGSLNKSSTKNVNLSLGERIDEDSWLRGSWAKKDAVEGGTVKWLAPTATFTQAATNSYNVTLAGGGNVYVEKDVTEGGVATTFIPTQLNFTDNGGYLTIDDDNVAIAGDIVAAINTTTGGVGFNVDTAESLALAMPAALQTGVDFKKKGAADLTLTGVTSVGTVTVAGKGALILPAETAFAPGVDTVVDPTYEGEGIKLVNSPYVAWTHGANDAVPKGFYLSLRAAVAAAEAGDTILLSVDDRVSFTADNLEIAIDKAITIDGAGHTLYGLNSYTGSGDHDIYINGNSDITIKNLTLAEFGGAVANTMRTYPIWTGSAYAGTLTLENVTVQNFNRTAFNLNGGTVVVKNCTITGDTTKEQYFQEGIGVYNATVTIENTTITGVGSTLEKEDSQVAACIQLGNPLGPTPGVGTITVKSGTFTGEYGVIVASNAQSAVSIEAGTFTGGLMVKEGEGGSISVTGGTFDSDVNEFCASGYSAYEDTTGVWTVSVTRNFQLFTSKTYFATLADAVAGNTNNEIIDQLVAVSDQAVTLDTGTTLKLRQSSSSIASSGTITLNGGTFEFDGTFDGGLGYNFVIASDSTIKGGAKLINGSVTGSANITVPAGSGVRFNGDLTAYTGTITYTVNTTSEGAARGFMGGTTGGEGVNVVINVDDTAITNPTRVWDIEKNGGTVSFGSLTVSDANAIVHNKNGCTMALCGSADSTLNCTFDDNGKTLTKSGTGKLTLGDGFKLGNGTVDSTLTVSAGSFTVLSSSLGQNGVVMANVAVTIADGVAIALPENAEAQLNSQGAITLLAAKGITADASKLVAPTGWKLSTTSRTVDEAPLYVLKLEKVAGIDPTDPTSSQTVTPTAEEIAAADGSAEAAAIAKATVTVPAGVTGVDAPTYKTYFTLTALAGDAGAYTVTIAGLSDDVVVDPVETSAIAALQSEAVGGQVTVTVKPGLYYGFVAGDSPTLADPAEYTLATGTSMSFTKPSGTGKGFVKVVISPSPKE